MERRYQKVTVVLDSSATSLDENPKVARDNILVQVSLINDSAFSAKKITQDSSYVPKIRQQQTELTSKTTSYNEIVTASDEFVVLTGVPGSGKSFLSETLVYHWSKGEIWQSNPSFDFVFIIYLRELGKFKEDKEITADKIFSHFYPDYKYNQPRTLLILEGFDELLGKEELAKHENKFTPYTRALFDLLNPNNSTLGYIRLVTSRPGSCKFLINDKRLEPKRTKIRILEITGFNESMIACYVEKHLGDEDKANSLLAEVKKNDMVYQMMRIPFYCYGICYLLPGNNTVNVMEMTKTSLYCHLFLLFIGEHGTRDNDEIDDLVKNEEFKKWCAGLAKLAFHLELNGTINFSKEDLPDGVSMEDLIKNSGMIIEIKNRVGPTYYQFLHYSFHEFLVALHLLITGKLSLELSHNIAIFLFGLIEGSLESFQSPYVVKQLAKAVSGSTHKSVLQFVKNLSNVDESILLRENSSNVDESILLYMTDLETDFKTVEKF